MDLLESSVCSDNNSRSVADDDKVEYVVEIAVIFFLQCTFCEAVELSPCPSVECDMRWEFKFWKL